jgi:long-chain acyl-CoA synthetase
MNVGKLSLESLEKHGEFAALHFDGKSYTNTERNLYAARLGNVLRNYGVKPGDHVVFMMPNSPDVTAGFQAAWKIGAVIIPVTPMLNAREVGYIVQNSESKVVVTTPILAQRLKDATASNPDFQHLLVIGDTAVEGARNIAPEIEAADPFPTLTDRADDDLSMLLYTSGTTGHPKGVMLTHKNLYENAKATASISDVQPQTMFLSVLPLSHSFGVMTMNVGYILGARSALLSHFDSGQALKTIQDYKVERFAAVPTMLTYLVNFPDRDQYDHSSLQKVNSGGAALPNEVRLDFERLYGCVVTEGYGLSETSPTATAYPDGVQYRPGSVGRAIPGVEVKIFSLEGKELPAGESGEICIKGSNVMKGYWKNPEATAEAMRGDWFRSGDVGYMDEGGYVYITDRTKDLIIKGGENISPREIEEAMHTHPSVAECAVIGLPSTKYGEDIAAVVVMKPGKSASEEELQAHVSQFVTKFKIPSTVIFMPFLPKNPVGKILKKDLRAMHALKK